MVLRVGHPSKKGNTDTSDARLDFRNRYVCNADGSPRGGVTSPVGTNLLSSTSSMSVALAAFSAVTVRDGGVVEMANDGPVNVPLDPPPSSQSRIDVVYGKQDDSSSTVSVPDSDDLPVFGVLKGDASSAPVARTDLPAGAIALGQALIPSTATATNSSGVVITTTCAFTAAAGGKVPFRTLADLKSWTTAGMGQDAYVFADTTAANNGTYTWSGLTWVLSTSSPAIIVRRSSTGVSGGPNVWQQLTTVGWWSLDHNVGFAAFDGTIVVPVTGWYRLFVGLSFSTSAPSALLMVTKNNASNTETGNILRQAIAQVAGEAGGFTSKLVKLTAGDVLRVQIFPTGSWTWGTDPDDGVFGLELAYI